MSSVFPRQEGGGGGGGGPPKGPPSPSAIQGMMQFEYNTEYSYLYWKVLAGLIGFWIVRNVVLWLVYASRTSNQPKTDRAPYPACLTHVEALANRTLRRPIFAGQRGVDLLAIGFVCIWNLVFLLVNTLPPHFVDSAHGSRMQFVAKRAGTIAIWNSPLVFALAGRNNVFTFLTGVETNKLRVIHKTVGRIMFIAGVLHGALMSATVVKFMGGMPVYKEFLKSDVPRQGIMAVCGLAILAGFSAAPVRRFLYEFFLLSHHAGAAIYLAGLYLHRPNHRPWVYACIALWAFDHLVRLCRIALSHLVYPIVHGDRGVSVGRMPARAELVSGAIVLRIPYAGSWRDSQHVFLTFLDGTFWTKPWIWLERHPWSVANISLPATGDQSHSEKGQFGVAQQKELLLIIRPKGGITQTLYRLCEAKPKPLPMNVIVDGPYGKSMDARGYERVLLVAGGSGITHVLSVFLSLIEKARNGQAGSTNACDLVWAIQHLDHLRWILPELNQAVASLPPASSIDFTITLYITRPMEAHSLPSNESIDLGRSSVENKKGSKKVSAGVFRANPVLSQLHESVERIMFVEQGRPDSITVLEEAARQTTGSMYLCACGPVALARDVQSAAARTTRPQDVDGKGKGWIKIDVAKFVM